MQKGSVRGTFDLCDDITSGMNMGSCEAVSTMQHAGSRDTKIAAELAAFPPSTQALAITLRSAEKAFEETRADKEIDMSGTAHGMYYEREIDILGAQFLINLQRSRKNDVPAATAQDLARLDMKLNTTFNRSCTHRQAAGKTTGRSSPTASAKRNELGLSWSMRGSSSVTRPIPASPKQACAPNSPVCASTSFTRSPPTNIVAQFGAAAAT